MKIRPVGVREDYRNALPGFIVHALFERWFKEARDHSTPDWLYEYYDEVFDAQCAQFTVLWKSPNDKEDLRKECHGWIRNTFELLVENDLLGGELISEKKFVHNASDTLQVVGKVDFVLKTPQTIIVVDFKGVKRKNVKYTDKNQLIVYDYVVGEHFEEKVEKAGFLWMGFRDITWYRFTPKDHQRVLNKWEAAGEEIKAKRFPAHPNQWNCRFCEYKSICSAFQEVFKGEKLFQNRTEGMEEGKVTL